MYLPRKTLLKYVKRRLFFSQLSKSSGFYMQDFHLNLAEINELNENSFEKFLRVLVKGVI